MLKSLSEPTTIIIVVLAITVVFAVAFMLSNKKNISQEQLEFLEYKRQKALKEKESAEKTEAPKKKSTKNTTDEKKGTSKSTTTKKKVTPKDKSK